MGANENGINQQQTNEYLIPKNVNAKFQFFPGFGWFELGVVLCGVIIGVIIFFILNIFTNSIWRAFSIVFPTVISLGIVQKDEKTGLSILSLISDYKKFNLNQRKYLYIYGKGRKNV